jgi:transcription elongation factor GreA-like protein
MCVKHLTKQQRDIIVKAVDAVDEAMNAISYMNQSVICALAELDVKKEPHCVKQLAKAYDKLHDCMDELDRLRNGEI